jgi:membrane protease YdiL (CAAX protease family)
MSKSAWHALFYSPNEPRLRAGWRLAIQLAMLGFLLLFEIFAFALANTFFHWKISDTGLFVLSTLFELVAFTGSIALARRFLDHRPFLDLGLRGFLGGGWGFGIFISLVIWLCVFVAMGSFRWFVGEWAKFDIGQLNLYLLLFVVIGFQEELLCRGYILKVVISGSNVFWGMLISSAIFAALHLGNPGAGWMAMLGIFLAGMLLAFAAVRTGKLWLSIGLHIGWNVFEGMVFGFPTSGVVIPAIMHIHVTGPVLWTGGAFGPEAGLIILPAIAIGAGLVWVFTS